MKHCVILALLALLFACKNGGSPTTATSPPASATGQASQADVTVTVGSPSQVSRSPDSQYSYRVFYRVALDEDAGVGFRIDFLRLRLSSQDSSRTETVDITASRIRSLFGSNQVMGNGRWSERVPFDFDLNDPRGPATLRVQITDALGNTLAANLDNRVRSPGPVPSPSPTPSPNPPSGSSCSPSSVPSSVSCGKPTARCKDGTWSCSKNRSGTCSSHGGVACWVCPGVLCQSVLFETSLFEMSTSARGAAVVFEDY